jgi:hypothetical protein
VVDVGDYIIYSSVTTYWYQVVPNFAQEDARYVQLAGSIMTGQLQGITPVSAPDMTRKDYVDNADIANSDEAAAALAAANAADANADTRILRAGDTMAGQLSGISPAAAANLTRRDYVDGEIASAVAPRKLNTDFLRTGDRLDIINVPVT